MAVSAAHLEGPEYVKFLEAREELRKAIEVQAQPPRACFDRGIIIAAGGAQLLTNAVLNVKVCEDFGLRSQATSKVSVVALTERHVRQIIRMTLKCDMPITIAYCTEEEKKQPWASLLQVIRVLLWTTSGRPDI